jgi:hypothetical protein
MAPTSYFDLKKCCAAGEVLTQAGHPCPVTGFPGAQAARALILARLWARIPCPVQIRAPSVPSRRVRSHP